MLRAHNADILFSSNQLTLYDDDQSKVQIPLIRPEDDRTFKFIRMTSSDVDKLPVTEVLRPAPASENGTNDSTADQPLAIPAKSNGPVVAPPSEDGSSIGRPSLEQRSFLGMGATRMEGKDAVVEPNPASSGSRSGTSPAVWSNWRRDTEKPSILDWASVGKNPPQAASVRKDTGMKVLRPLKAATRSLSSGSSTTQAHLSSHSPATTGQSRFFDEGKRRESAVPELKRSVSTEKSKDAKDSASLTAKPSSANPVGGASAFAWLNSSSSGAKQ